VTKARKAIANFKIRQGVPIGCMVTLRGAGCRVPRPAGDDRLPRVRDFAACPGRAFDGKGTTTSA